MKKADVEKNTQLIHCWNEIRQWVLENCKGDRGEFTIPTEHGKAFLDLNQGDATIDYRDERGNYSVYRIYFTQGLKKSTLKYNLRKIQLPFYLIEQLVKNCSTIKDKILTAKIERMNIFNFKA